MGRRVLGVCCVVVAGVLSAWSLPDVRAESTPQAPVIKRVTISLGEYVEAPMGLDPVRIPKDNPQTDAKIALGRLLFFDPRLSADGTVSCSSCHDPQLGWSNGLSAAWGIRGQTGRRSAPTVLNAAYADTLFWDGRAASLEAQAEGPIVNPIEMGNTPEQVVATLRAIPGYVQRFADVFGGGPDGGQTDGEISLARVAKAIAAYERTLISGNSPFDRYKYGGDKSAMGGSQVRGMGLFRDKEGPNCAKCHRFDDFSADFTDFRFRNIGVGMDHPNPDLGRSVVTGRAEDRGKFRVPTLRNVAQTAPYMHDGRFATLGQVVDFYARGGTPNAQLDPEIHPFKLTPQERADLVAFLEALTGDLHLDAPPELPPFPKSASSPGGPP